MLKRIPTPEEYELEKAYKALRLNGIEVNSLRVTTTPTKPTFRVKRPGLKGASSLQKEKEKAEKALRLNGI